MVAPIGEFYGRHPGIEIHIVNLTSSEMIERVQHGTLDLAVVGVGPDELPDGIEGIQLATDPLVGVLCDKAAAGVVGPVSVAGLLSRGQLIQFAPGSGIRKHVDAALRRAGVEASSAFEMTQVTDMLRFAVLGLGVTIVPRALTRTAAAELAELKQPYVVLGLTDPQAVHPVTVIFEPRRLSVPARELADVLTQGVLNKKKRST
jgi:DNA-binding transcriptional LysR family regulator